MLLRNSPGGSRSRSEHAEASRYVGGSITRSITRTQGTGLRDHEPPPPPTERPILLFGLVILVFYAADTGILTWSSVYLHDALDATKSVAPLAFAGYETGAIPPRWGRQQSTWRLPASISPTISERFLARWTHRCGSIHALLARGLRHTAGARSRGASDRKEVHVADVAEPAAY